jgi:hypothetical protein
VYDGVGTGTYFVHDNVVGTYHVGTITAVVPGIVTIYVNGTVVGTSVPGIITGFGGKVGTRIY